MDTVGEFLTRIRNAGMAKHEKVDVPSSKLRVGIASVLKSSGFISDYRTVDDGKQGMMRVYLKYKKTGAPTISNVHRVSKPSCRVYVKSNEIKPVRSGFGTAIFSTSKGIVSGQDAAGSKLGGEYLCRVW